MTALAHPPTAIALPRRDRAGADSLAPTALRLLPSGDGWSLVDRRGRLVFHGLGTHGRRRCLEYARAHGVLAVLS